MKKFPDTIAPTKVTSDGLTISLRRCRLRLVADPTKQWDFENEEVRLGAMDDNDIVLTDETVSRYHAKIIQEHNGYVLVDNRSTNGSFVDGVRVREAFLRPGARIAIGQAELDFEAIEETVAIAPSRQSKFGRLVGRHPRMQRMYGIIEKIAKTPTTVIIEGETGTGKEVVAQTIHDLSPRKDQGLVVFDCSAVPPNLIESELFGHEKGSFTGAMVTRQGLFEQADGGTLFLDELGELPLDLQPKLLRALEQREVRRVGGAKPIKVDVRIIAATNRNLEEEVKAGRFRQDLYFRLSVVKLDLPPLRERREDIPLLVEHFLKIQKERHGADLKVTRFDASALAALAAYNWPGNVRELVNAVERTMSFSEGDTVTVADLPDNVRDAKGGSHPGVKPLATKLTPSVPLQGVSDVVGTVSVNDPHPGEEFTGAGVTFKDAKERWVAAFERDYIASLLKRHNGNISHASRESDIDRKYFRKLMKKYDIVANDNDTDDE
ncbi:MAG: sigma 54-interacting transcriptional regulator [Myxococcales bacterium]|nr:sigma 54-interacting transcriptional regulator [Myxococcales bacterium]